MSLGSFTYSPFYIKPHSVYIYQGYLIRIRFIRYFIVFSSTIHPPLLVRTHFRQLRHVRHFFFSRNAPEQLISCWCMHRSPCCSSPTMCLGTLHSYIRPSYWYVVSPGIDQYVAGRQRCVEALKIHRSVCGPAQPDLIAGCSDHFHAYSSAVGGASQ